MIHLLEIRTLMFALAAGNLVLGGLALAFHRSARWDGTANLWAAGRLAQGVGWGLLWLRDLIPDVLSIPLANSLLHIGLALEAAAGMRHVGWRRWGPAVVGPALLIVLTFNGAFIAQVTPALRMAISSVCIGILYGMIALPYVSSWRRVSPVSRYIGLSNLLLLAVGIGNAILVFRSDWQTIDQGGMAQAMALLPLIAFMFANSFGFMVMAREALDAALLRMATQDGLTQALNRQTFLERTGELHRLAQRLGHPNGLLLLDLDRFKDINDLYGHAVGDQVLRQFADICRQTLRGTDPIGRLGGEEFAILLPATDLTGTANLAERLRANVAATVVSTPNGPIRFTVSIGITLISTDETVPAAMLRCDRALYQAKAEGRNRVSLADPVPA